LARRLCRLIHLGIEPYGPMQALQNELVRWRQQGRVGDTLLLLEHTPVITLGRRADEAHILSSLEVLANEGIKVHQSERGGDVTYHGPGQLIGYPILRLRNHHIGASDYMHRLEEVIVRTLADYDLVAHRRQRTIGVWVGENKIAAFGVRIKRGVTMHGFALNVSPKMEHWSHIVPCGITDGGVTSMAVELGFAPRMWDVRDLVVQHMEDLFNLELVSTTLGQLQEIAEMHLGQAMQRTASDQVGATPTDTALHVLWLPCAAGSEGHFQRSRTL